jgi:uncharacterized protein (TIGR03437 family)
VNFTATASSVGNWLTVDTASASTPATINVGINPQNLPAVFPAGGLTGAVTIGATGAQPPSIAIPVTLSGPPAPQPSTIQNSASLKFGAIAPGEFITILGANLGPSTPASFTVNPQGGIASTLAGVQVMFDAFPGTPTYVSATQINVAVPYEIAGQATTNVSVIYGGQQSAVFPLAVVPVAPGIFTFTANGLGQAIAINVSGPTAGMTNGPSSGVPISGITIASAPASEGAFIAVYGTGGGATNPAAKTGSVNSITTVLPLANWSTASGTVTATVGGVPAYVAFAGAAPGLSDGVYQFNIQIPVGVSGNALPLAITVNGVSTAVGPTIAVQ